MTKRTKGKPVRRFGYLARHDRGSDYVNHVVSPSPIGGQGNSDSYRSLGKNQATRQAHLA